MSNTAIGGPRSIRPCADILLRRRLGTISPSRQAAGRRFRKRFAAARQAWIGHERFVRVERRLAAGRLDTRARAVEQEHLLRQGISSASLAMMIRFEVAARTRLLRQSGRANSASRLTP